MSIAPASRRQAYIDVIRGGACFWVLLHHSFYHKESQGGVVGVFQHALVRLSDIGWLGVTLFLVLSGFCLYYPLVRRTPVGSVRLDLREFARRRAWRILPTYYAALGLMTLWGWGLAHYGHSSLTSSEGDLYRHPLQLAVHFAAHLLLLHNLWPATFSTINGVFWSLALEAQLYLLFPLFVVVAARYGLKALLLMTLGVSLLWQSVVYCFLGLSLGSSDLLSTAYHALPGRCFEFAAGMVAAAVVARPTVHNARPFKIAAIMLLLPALYFVLKVSRYGPLCDQALGVIFAGLIMSLATLPEKVWDNPLLRWLNGLGLISYSVYLIHGPILADLQNRLLGSSRSSLMAYLVCLAIIAVSIFVGWVFYLVAEKPAIQYLKGKNRPLTETPKHTSTPVLSVAGDTR